MPLEALRKLRAKYPQYADFSDQELARRILARYPQYRDLLGDIAAGVSRTRTELERGQAAAAAYAPAPGIPGPARRTARRETFASLARPEPGQLRYEGLRVPRILNVAELAIQRNIAEPAAAFGPGFIAGGIGQRVFGQAAERVATGIGARLARLRTAPRPVAPPVVAAPVPEPVAPAGPVRPLPGTPGYRIPPGAARAPFTPLERGLRPGESLYTPTRALVGGPGVTRGRIPPVEAVRVASPETERAYAFVRALEAGKKPPLEPTAPPPPSVAQRVVFPIGGGASPARVRQTQDARTILNRVFGGGWGDKYLQTTQFASRIFSPRNVVLRKAGLPQITTAEDLSILQSLEGRGTPITSRAARIVNLFRSMDVEDKADYIQRGARVIRSVTVRDPNTGAILRRMSWEPFRGIQNYAPRMLDPRRVAAADPMRLAGEIQSVNAKMPAQDAADVVALLRARAFGQPRPTNIRPEIVQLIERGSSLPTHLHARGPLVLPDSILRPMREAIPLYLEDAARERAFLRAFGADADEVVDNLVNQLGPLDPHARLAEEVWNTYRGRVVTEETARRQKQVGRILNNVATATLLGFQTAVSQVSQFAALAGKFGAKNLARGLARVVLPGGRFEAELAGAYVNSMIDEFVRFSPLSPTATGADVLERATARLASGVVKYSGIRALDQMPRAVGFHAARFYLQDLQRAAALGNNRAAAELARRGVSAASTADEIVDAAAGMSRKLNVTAGEAELPFWMRKSVVGQFFRGLNTFNVQVTRMIQDEFIGPAVLWARTGGKQGAVAPLVRFLAASLATGETIGEVRRALAGRRGDRPGGTTEEFVGDLAAGRVPARVVALRAADELAWAGALGIVQNMYQSVLFSMSPEESLSRGLVSTAVGAGVSSGFEALTGAEALARAGVTAAAATGAEGEERERMLRGAARAGRTGARIAVRRVPLVGGIAAPRVFRSSVADRRVALGAIVRALRRGDTPGAVRILEEYQRRHGERISQAAIDKAFRQYYGPNAIPVQQAR